MSEMPVSPSEIERLTPLPATLQRLAHIAFDPEIQAAEIAQVISFDQALTAKVLHWANSSWSAAEVPVVSVKDAVVRLGGGHIFKLAAGQYMASSLKKPLPGYELVENELWLHSMGAALAAECLPEVTGLHLHPAAFTAALMHDVGKLLISRHIKFTVLERIREMINRTHCDYIEAEREVLKTDHAEVGGAMARHWKFPVVLVNAIEHHHDPEPAPDPVLDAVQVANAVVKIIGIGVGSEELNMTIHPDVTRRLGLNREQLEQLCLKVVERSDETRRLWEG